MCRARRARGGRRGKVQDLGGPLRLLQRSGRQRLGCAAAAVPRLARRGSGDDVEAISNGSLTYVTLVQVPPRGAREANLQLEELEHQGEPEARRFPLVGHQRTVPVHQRPADDQVLGLLLPPHGTPGTVRSPNRIFGQTGSADNCESDPARLSPPPSSSSRCAWRR